MQTISGRALLFQVAALLAPSCSSNNDVDVGQPADAGPTTSAVLVALTVEVVGPNGEVVPGFRWLLERDLTYRVSPGVADPATLAVRFHRSHMPVVQAGTSAAPPMIDSEDLEAAYFLSVLPDSGYAMGGAQIAAGQTQVTVVVNQLPLPTAQVTVFVFRDDAPINNAADLPGEDGLAGFAIQLEDAGGRYGQSGGHQTKDAFDNPLGTTYDADGNVVTMGDGMIFTGPDGTATIKNLAPGKYGIKAVPPPGSSWVQTSTIEGTKIIDAWVKANEPAYFMEFGPPGYHAAIGFVQPMKDTTVLTGGSTISGQVVNLHMSRPPDCRSTPARRSTHTNVWVGLNTGPAGAGRGVFAAKAARGRHVHHPQRPSRQLPARDLGRGARPDLRVPQRDRQRGRHLQLARWIVRSGRGARCSSGSRASSTRCSTTRNANGFRDPGRDRHSGDDDQPALARRHASISPIPTDIEGFVPFDEVFPFFNYLVAEVDYARFKATGVTVTVDDGGPIDPDRPVVVRRPAQPAAAVRERRTALPHRDRPGADSRPSRASSARPA